MTRKKDTDISYTIDCLYILITDAFTLYRAYLANKTIQNDRRQRRQFHHHRTPNLWIVRWNYSFHRRNVTSLNIQKSRYFQNALQSFKQIGHIPAWNKIDVKLNATKLHRLNSIKYLYLISVNWYNTNKIASFRKMLWLKF